MSAAFSKLAFGIDPSSPEFIEKMYGHLVSIGADKHDPKGFKADYEKALATAKAKHSKKEPQMADNKTPYAQTVAQKQAAFTSIYAENYVPAFVKRCAELGLTFSDEADLAHALQLNGKFASLAADGVSMDALINGIMSQVNVKHASVGNMELDFAGINHALDATLVNAGVKIASVNQAVAVDYQKVASVSDKNIIDIATLLS